MLCQSMPSDPITWDADGLGFHVHDLLDFPGACRLLAGEIDRFLDQCRLNGEDYGAEGIRFSAFLPSISDAWQRVLTASTLCQLLGLPAEQQREPVQRPSGTDSCHHAPGPARDLLDVLTSLRTADPIRREYPDEWNRLRPETIDKLNRIRGLLLELATGGSPDEDWIWIQVAAAEFDVSLSRLRALVYDGTLSHKRSTASKQSRVFVLRSEVSSRFRSRRK